MITHQELCTIGAKFVHNNWIPNQLDSYPYACIELKTCATKEIPDVFAWNYYTSCVLEAKVSKSDFLRDLKKPFRINPKDGVGENRFFICEEGLILPAEVPENWGLIYASKDGCNIVKSAVNQVSNFKAERGIITSIFRRENNEQKVYSYGLNFTKES